MRFTIDIKLSLYLIFLVWVVRIHHAQSETVKRSSYIIHMNKASMPTAFTSQDNWYTSTVRSLVQHDLTSTNESRSAPQLIYSYDKAIHGFSALLSPKELETLKSSPGFVSSYSDREIKCHTTHTPNFLSLNQVSGIWPASNYGENIVVGVVDSGVWPESFSFDDYGMTEIPTKWKGTCELGEEFNTSMCNSKLIGARYFNKGLIAANKPGFKPKMNSARDIQGHGTHTASTAVGNYVEGVSYFEYAKGTSSGIAPRARLAVYKVFWEEGSYSSDFLAAIDQAVADGVDVLSLSIGNTEYVPLDEDVFAIASFGAMEQGILVSHSVGNEGPDFGSALGSMPWSLSVGAGTIDRWFAGTLTLGNEESIIGWSTFPAGGLIDNMTLVYDQTVSSCDSSLLLLTAPVGIIICEDMGDVATQLYYVKQMSSYISAAIYISDDLSFYSFVGQFHWPGVVIRSNDLSTVINYALTKEPTASIRFQQTILGKTVAPYVATYSSRGPSQTYNGIITPDLIAPGSLVLAAWVPTLPVAQIGSGENLTSSYHMISGTSMACPHASGVAALLKSAHPKWTPAMIRSAMMTTANPLDNSGKAIRDQGRNFTQASPLQMGSGHIDPNRALDPGLVYDASPEDYVNLLCYMNYTASQLLTVTRSANYNCSTPSGDLNYPSFIALYSGTSSAKLVQTFQRILTNVGNGTTYHAKWDAPPGSTVSVTPETLVFDQIYDKKGFTMIVEYKSDKNMIISYGELVWIENDGEHTDGEKSNCCISRTETYNISYRALLYPKVMQMHFCIH